MGAHRYPSIHFASSFPVVTAVIGLLLLITEKAFLSKVYLMEESLKGASVENSDKE
ncbi:MAG: hypothetical protein P8Y65_03005 [Campylobacterales bacterium]|jgi:hypothetical protein